MVPHNLFKHHRFPKDVILLAVRWYCRYPLTYRDVRDLLAERGISVDASTIHRWVRKFGPEIAKRSFKRRSSWRGLNWHVPSRQIASQSPDEQWMKPTFGLAANGATSGVLSISTANSLIFT